MSDFTPLSMPSFNVVMLECDTLVGNSTGAMGFSKDFGLVGILEFVFKWANSLLRIVETDPDPCSVLGRAVFSNSKLLALSWYIQDSSELMIQVSIVEDFWHRLDVAFGGDIDSLSKSGSNTQNPPLPGSPLVLSTLVKHLFRDRLWRIEF